MALIPAKHKLPVLCLCLLLGLRFSAFAQLPADRTVDWSRAGHNAPPPSDLLVVDILDFGGKPDGQSDNCMAFEAAVVSLGGAPGAIYFPAGTYLFQNQISLPSYTVLRGVSAQETTLRFDLIAPDDAILIQGEPTDIESPLTGSAEKDETKIKVEQADLFEPGDYVLLYEDDQDLIVSSWALHTTGQLNQVVDVEAEELRLRSPLRRSFQPDKLPRLKKIQMIEQAGIENLRIERLDATTEKNSNVLFHYTANCWVRCVESALCNYAHLEVARSTNLEITGSYLHDAHDYGAGGKAYGVMLHYSTGECLVENNIFEHLRHAMILQAGANGNVVAYNYSVDPFWTQIGLPPDSAGDLVLHGNFPYANLLEGNIVQNIVVDDSHGSQGPFNTLFRNRAEKYGILFSNVPPSDRQNLLGNEVTATFGLFALYGQDHFVYGNNVRGITMPAGTEDLNIQSLYFDDPPSYFPEGQEAWPPLGLPNQLNEFTIQSQIRFAEEQFIECLYEPDTTTVVGLVPTPASEESMNWKVFPNPVIRSFQVQTGAPNGLDLLQLTDLRGQTLRQWARPGPHTQMNVKGLKPGIYLLRGQLREGSWLSEKLIVLP